MKKKELVKAISGELLTAGFNKKGNYWVNNGQELTQIVNLQKSQYSNRYYINYGYIIKSIPLDGLFMHVFKGLGSTDIQENNRIKELLDLENNIPDKDRLVELKNFINDKIITDILSVSTEKDLLNQLKSKLHLNDVPLIVKKHFELI